MGQLAEEPFEDRLRNTISTAWQIFARKVGGGLIPVNKEASMQLQYASILKQLLPLAVFHADETVDLELETGLKTKSGRYNVDILVRASKGVSDKAESNIAIEMKCYRNRTSSGGSRGAHDIFMKDVYEDLHVLEEYVAAGCARQGVALVMTDLDRFVTPRSKEGKCWAYDTSNGFVFPGGEITIPIGGKPVHVVLERSHSFNWTKFGDFWFAEIEGVVIQSNKPAIG